MKVSTLTIKGQVTIPAEIRAKLHLKTGDRVGFAVDGDRAVIVPLTGRIEDSFALIRAKRTVSLDDMEQAIRKRGGR